jgi:antitoxin component YwqK of YwqJK toxin-antitoxin module
MFYPNGKVMERGTYDKGVKVGTWTRFRETGAKERVANFAAGLLQGTWTEYDEDGRVAVVGTYLNDLRHGKWTYFERGTAVRTEMYRRGILEKPGT